MNQSRQMFPNYSIPSAKSGHQPGYWSWLNCLDTKLQNTNKYVHAGLWGRSRSGPDSDPDPVPSTLIRLKPKHISVSLPDPDRLTRPDQDPSPDPNETGPTTPHVRTCPYRYLTGSLLADTTNQIRQMLSSLRTIYYSYLINILRNARHSGITQNYSSAASRS
jgi:hypothetical protein